MEAGQGPGGAPRRTFIAAAGRRAVSKEAVITLIPALVMLGFAAYGASVAGAAAAAAGGGGGAPAH